MGNRLDEARKNITTAATSDDPIGSIVSKSAGPAAESFRLAMRKALKERSKPSDFSDRQGLEGASHAPTQGGDPSPPSGGPAGEGGAGVNPGAPGFGAAGGRGGLGGVGGYTPNDRNQFNSLLVNRRGNPQASSYSNGGWGRVAEDAVGFAGALTNPLLSAGKTVLDENTETDLSGMSWLKKFMKKLQGEEEEGAKDDTPAEDEE